LIKYPKAIEDLINAFSKYPGIGKKTAERLALFTINNIKEEDVEMFREALKEIKESIFHCSICGNITDVEPCYICSDLTREKTTIMVVEEAKDVLIIEKTNQYHGLYHVLGGTISPLDGRGPDDINLSSLLNRLKDDNITEVILALNASVDGETTSMYINKLLEKSDILITKLAHGLPVGGDLQYADEMTLQRALEGRRKI